MWFVVYISLLIFRYVGVVMGAVRAANRYVDREAPWALAKTDKERMATVLAVLCEVSRP